MLRADMMHSIIAHRHSQADGTKDTSEKFPAAGNRQLRMAGKNASFHPRQLEPIAECGSASDPKAICFEKNLRISTSADALGIAGPGGSQDGRSRARQAARRSTMAPLRNLLGSKRPVPQRAPDNALQAIPKPSTHARASKDTLPRIEYAGKTLPPDKDSSYCAAAGEDEHAILYRQERKDQGKSDFSSHENQHRMHLPAIGATSDPDCIAQPSRMPMPEFAAPVPAPSSAASTAPELQAFFFESNVDGAIAAPIIAAYRRVGVQLNPKTYPWFFCHRSRLSRLGAGSFNKVQVVTIANPDSGVRERFALKRESANRSISEQEEVAGISVQHSQHGLRNLATCAVAEALDWPVVPKTRFALVRHDANEGSSGMRLSLHLAMKVVDGQPAATFKDNQWFSAVDDPRTVAHFSNMLCTPPVKPEEWSAALRKFGFHHVDMASGKTLVGCRSRPNPKIDFNHPRLKRELTMLAFLDFIVAHLDRHQGNYRINMKTSSKSKVAMVGGYDNDATFGKNLRTPEDIKRALKSYNFFSVGLPEVIDTEMADALRRLNLREVLAGILDGPEIEAAQTRLNCALAHLEQLGNAGKVIDPDRWAEQKFDDPARSYIAREGLQPAKISSAALV